MSKKVILSFSTESPSVRVLAEDTETNVKRSFSLPYDAVPAMFGNNWSTGYFSVSQDGPIYLESRNGRVLVVVQRAKRSQQTVQWAGEEYQFVTPWTIFLFSFSPVPEGYHLHESFVYTTTGPSLGDYTQLLSAYWMGNVYTEDKVCWGSTHVGVEGIVSIASATNFANDFFYQPFTPDLQSTITPWRTYTQTGNMPSVAKGSLREAIAKFWGDND